MAGRIAYQTLARVGEAEGRAWSISIKTILEGRRRPARDVAAGQTKGAR